MKHEITTEFRNKVIEAIANSIVKITVFEAKQLIEKLATLPIISELKVEEPKQTPVPPNISQAEK